MTALPYSHFDVSAAPEPMAALTNRIISPENIAMEARLSRAKPLTAWQIRSLNRQAVDLERQIKRLAHTEEADTAAYLELRDTLKILLDYKFELAQKRQINPEDRHLAAQWRELYEYAAPLERDYQQLRLRLKKVRDMRLQVAAIRQRIADNPEVIEKQRQEAEQVRIQKEEARAYEQLIIDRFTQLGYCYRWVDNKGNKRVDEVQFSEVHITMDAVYFKIAASYRTALGAWKTKMPLGVRVGELVKEETLLELSYACQRQVSARANLVGGAWIVVHRLDTNDGLVNQVRFSEVMKRYPHKYRDKLTVCVGVTLHRNIEWLPLTSYPHVLIAGFTGSGKSNYINGLICTLITKYSPDELRLVLVDLKDGIEFSSYENLPHLHGKVVDKIPALADRLQELEAVMADRNHLMRGRAKTIGEFNAKYPAEALPRIVCIIDEVASIIAHGENTKRINNSLRQLTAKGRAPGIHIVLSTQRPSVDAIDGGIKVNLAARIVGRMPSHTDSLTVLGTGEAKEIASVPGRMILQIGPDPIPVQTPYIEESDIVEALKVAMAYPAPAPLPVPADMVTSEEWTPERIVGLSLNFLGGNISHSAIWNEIKDDGGITQRGSRDMLERIWRMDCIEYEGKQYRTERGKGKVKRLVEIPKSINSSIPVEYTGDEIVTESAIDQEL